jgi:hypothetical protein
LSTFDPPFHDTDRQATKHRAVVCVQKTVGEAAQRKAFNFQPHQQQTPHKHNNGTQSHHHRLPIQQSIFQSTLCDIIFTFLFE